MASTHRVVDRHGDRLWRLSRWPIDSVQVGVLDRLARGTWASFIARALRGRARVDRTRRDVEYHARDARDGRAGLDCECWCFDYTTAERIRRGRDAGGRAANDPFYWSGAANPQEVRALSEAAERDCAAGIWTMGAATVFGLDSWERQGARKQRRFLIDWLHNASNVGRAIYFITDKRESWHFADDGAAAIAAVLIAALEEEVNHAAGLQVQAQPHGAEAHQGE